MMRRQTAEKPADPVRERFVYDKALVQPGGALAHLPTMTRDREKVVMMSDSAALFYLTQGSLGNEPRASLEERPAAVAAQVIGEAPKGKK